MSHTVFPVFAAGSLHWWHDESLYRDYAPLDYFRYPPSFAIAFTPFAVLGPQLGGVLWGWVTLGVYALGLWRLRRDVLPGCWTPGRASAFTLLAILGALPGIWNGQSNALLTGLLMLGAAEALRERWWSAALLLSLPVAFKLTPLPVCLLLCALWPARLGPRFVVCAIFGLALPLLTRDPELVAQHFREWVEHLRATGNERWPGFRDGWTVWVVLRHLAEGGTGLPDLKTPLLGDWYRGLQVSGGLAVLAWVLWLKPRCESRTLVTLTLSVGVGWLLLLGPAAEFPTFAFLAPFLAWNLVQPGDRVLKRTAGACILVLGWNSLTRPLWPVAPWLVLALPLGTTLFLVLCGRDSRRHALSTSAAVPALPFPLLASGRRSAVGHVSNVPGTTGTLETCPTDSLACPCGGTPHQALASTQDRWFGGGLQ